MKNMMNKTIFLITIILLLSACSSRKNDTAIIMEEAMDDIMEYTTNYSYGTDVYQSDYDNISYNTVAPGGMTYDREVYYNDSVGVVVDNSKIIMTGDVYIDTNDFDTALNRIRNMVAFYNGYTSNSNVHRYTNNDRTYRRYKATVKIPAESFSYAFDNIKSMSGVKSASQYQENVSEQYSNTESRLQTRKIEEERILNMIARTTEVAELLGLERRLAQVRTDISLYESQIKNINMLVAYSTINISINEVEGTTVTGDESFIDRITRGFKTSVRWLLDIVQSITYVVAATILPLAVFVVIAFIVIIVFRKVRRVTGKD